MARHGPREARTLGLWTAAWLGGLLLGGLLWLGDLSLQWPVLMVPVLWALVACARAVTGGGRRSGHRSSSGTGPTRWCGRPCGHLTAATDRP